MVVVSADGFMGRPVGAEGRDESSESLTGVGDQYGSASAEAPRGCRAEHIAVGGELAQFVQGGVQHPLATGGVETA